MTLSDVNFCAGDICFVEYAYEQRNSTDVFLVLELRKTKFGNVILIVLSKNLGITQVWSGSKLVNVIEKFSCQ